MQESPYLASPDLRRLQLEEGTSEVTSDTENSLELEDEDAQAIQFGLPLPTVIKETLSPIENFEDLTLTADDYMTTAPVQTQTYAATIATTITAPSGTKTESPPPKQITITGGGTLSASGRMQRTGGMVTSRRTSRGTAWGKTSIAMGITGSGPTSSGVASVSGSMQGGRSVPLGSTSGQGAGGSSTGGSGMPVGSSTGGNLPAGLPGGPLAGSGGGGGNPGGQPNPGRQAAQAAMQGGPVPPINRAMKGHPPEIFNGDRAKMHKFMKEFALWKLCNLTNEVMANPFSRVALALSYIKGTNIDDWVEQEVNETYWKVHGDLDTGQAATHQINDKMLWNEFVGDFANTFEDTATHKQAYADLTKLEMRNNKANNYIATFKCLINQAGWDRMAHSSVEMFKNGLPRRMVFTILQCDQVLHSIGEWQTAIQNEVQ